MKRLALILTLLYSGFSSAQFSVPSSFEFTHLDDLESTTSLPTADKGPNIPAWQAGFVATDMVLPALSLEASFQLEGRHHLGVKLSRPFYFSFYDDDLYNLTNWAFKGGLFHKIFFSPNNIDMLTFRHGLRAGISDLSFSATSWVPYEQFGSTRLEYRDVSFSDQPISLGYEILLGWQSSYEVFYFEMYFGISYETFINEADLLAPDYKGDYYSLSYFGPGYEYDSGVRPVLGLVIGLTDPY